MKIAAEEYLKCSKIISYSGQVDPCELLSSIETQLAKAREESLTRKDIMEKVDRWLSACDEETWLEEYNQVRFIFVLIILNIHIGLG